MSEGLKKVESFSRDIMKALLSECTEKQIEIFNRLYGSMDTIPFEKIPWAIQQIERTIEKNGRNHNGNPER